VTVWSFADTRFPIERANGAQTMATCQALAARGHDVTLVVRADPAGPGRDPFRFYGVSPASRLQIRYVPTSRGRLTNRLRFLTTAVSLVRSSDGLVYTRDLGLAALILAWPRLLPVRVVYESHGVAPIVSQELPRLLGQPALAPSAGKLRRLDRRERRVWTRAHAYVAITQALAAELAARYGPRDRVFVIPDGAPPADTADAVGVTLPLTARPVAAYAGHLYPWKGVDVFVRALALAPEIDGLIVGGHPGEPDLARVTALARDVGVSDRLEITGIVPPAEVEARLARAAFLVLPNTASAISDRYTSPLKLFEYLRLGRAIVASDLIAIREVLAHEDTALLVQPDDAQALADALRRLAADPALARTLGRRARALAGRFTWAARASRLEAAFLAARS
jgi:glycosyltransferase involved in cell wall biosynthesis